MKLRFEVELTLTAAAAETRHERDPANLAKWMQRTLWRAWRPWPERRREPSGDLVTAVTVRPLGQLELFRNHEGS